MPTTFDLDTVEGPMTVTVTDHAIVVRRKQPPVIEETRREHGVLLRNSDPPRCAELGRAVVAGGPFFHAWWCGTDDICVDVEAGFERFTKHVGRQELMRKWLRRLGLRTAQVKTFLDAEPKEETR